MWKVIGVMEWEDACCGTFEIVLIGPSMLSGRPGYQESLHAPIARQGAAYKDLAERVHTICFLARPHRGSDSAKLLNNILHFAYSSRAYVADLERDFGAVQSTNDEFSNYSAEVHL